MELSFTLMSSVYQEGILSVYYNLNQIIFLNRHSMRLVQNDIATDKGAQQLVDILTIN